jgi:exonuclease III
MIQQRKLHIVSWNVAGWTPTLKKIINHNGSLQSWMDKHSIDILCIQEVKIKYTNIFHDAGATGHDFEAFFGCPR